MNPKYLFSPMRFFQGKLRGGVGYGNIHGGPVDVRICVQIDPYNEPLYSIFIFFSLDRLRLRPTVSLKLLSLLQLLRCEMCAQEAVIWQRYFIIFLDR